MCSTHASQDFVSKLCKVVVQMQCMQRRRWPRGTLLPWPSDGLSSALLLRGFVGGPGRLSAVVELLRKFEFEHLEDLDCARLDVLPDFESLHADDRSFLSDLVDILTSEGVEARQLLRVARRSAPPSTPSTSQKLDVFAPATSRPVRDVAGKGPVAVLQKPTETEVGRESAGCQASMDSRRTHGCGFGQLPAFSRRCCTYVDRSFLNRRGVVAWSSLFKCSRTF